ncbi:hypothetical protein DICPUDRAFT_96597 [Dictyostelium purpureum]|uniref:Bet v I/Major latex protein domain-containing protein n=1 Tax=Dictyostelium purpureum TaxID=5786 RepID=F0Z9T7_DICPU|nr:uncharacterized protein DICPUDRAFT_96597 [Dictyostelium purpureum]EGC39270.1 hypothetical protein DICPUDRAFT_96597 [Dictyostelium purpureum]|eukprot:XP_003284174.1 hypothetical protein DICPUDRAFT_96597 [Dictyostelium purpureum]
MSTRVYQSAEVKQNIEKVWKVLREFTFPEKVFSFIESCVIEGSNDTPTSVGAVQLSDYRHTLTYELISSEPATEVIAYITTIKLYRNSQTDSTLITWEADFSADVSSEVVQFESKAFALNLSDLQKFFSK